MSEKAAVETCQEDRIEEAWERKRSQEKKLEVSWEIDDESNTCIWSSTNVRVGSCKAG